MQILTPIETAQALQQLGLDAPIGIGFAFSNRAQDIFYGWHAHDYHQLLYAVSGTTQLETEDARFFLPPQRAAWIPAGVAHRTLISDVDGASLYFAPTAVPGAGDRMRILVATPVMREMVMHALRWPRGASESDPVAASFFATLALMCGEWLDSELPFSLPRAAHQGISRAMDYALADPGAATSAGAIAAACLSERTFRRIFQREAGMTWQTWLSQARMMAAMTRLSEGARVTDVAADVGFASLSAFAKAFAAFTGEGPVDYRRRVRGG